MPRLAQQPAYATLADLLMGMTEAGRLTRKQLAEAALRSHSWACDLVNAEKDPDWWRDLRLLLQNLPADVAHDMLTLLTANTKFQTPAPAFDDLDVNHDGNVDLTDALDSAIAGLKAGQAALERIREAQQADQLNGLHASGIVAEVSRGIRAGETVVQILTRLSQGQRGGPRIAG